MATIAGQRHSLTMNGRSKTMENGNITITLSHRDAELIRSVLWFEWMNMDLEDETDDAVGRVLLDLDDYLRLED